MDMQKNTSHTIAIICFIFTLVILYWSGNTRLNEFQNYHTQLAHKSVQDAANSITDFIEETRRMVAVFAQEHRQLIMQVIESPNDIDLYSRLKEQANLYFPTHFAISIASAEGTPYLVDFDDVMGQRCVNDIRTFADSSENTPVIHPHHTTYHYDVMAHIPDSGNQILFISFATRTLSDHLARIQIPGHELYLVSKEKQPDWLIEVTTEGPRHVLNRNDFHLKKDETARILADHPVKGTDWYSMDIHTPDLYKAIKKEIIINSAVILVIVVSGIIITLAFLRREKLLRQETQKHKDDFLAVVSHELRTPLTSIRGSIDLLRNLYTNSDHNVEKLADIIKNNSIRLELLVNDILDAQKLESGKFSLDFTEFDFIHTCKQVIENTQMYAQQYASRYQLVSSPESIKVCADEKRVNQVLLNLLSNAAKYGKANDVIDINITMQKEQVKFEITDHGNGINESFRKQIFTRFAREDSSASRHATGTGLGLYIVRQLVEAHGGKVGFTSQPGETTFYFQIPLTECPENPASHSMIRT